MSNAVLRVIKLTSVSSSSTSVRKYCAAQSALGAQALPPGDCRCADGQIVVLGDAPITTVSGSTALSSSASMRGRPMASSATASCGRKVVVKVML